MRKKIPLRRCLGCNEQKPKKELIRIVKNKLDEISIDLTGRSNGRGAYICENPECLKKLIKTRRLEKAFSTSIDDEIYQQLLKEIGDKGEE